MEPDVLRQGHPDARLLPPQEGSAASSCPQPPAGAGVSRGAVRGGLGIISLRVGLLGWCFCLKQVQLDLLQWLHASLELVTGCFFCWLQLTILACTTLLLLVWKLHTEAKKHGWRMFLRGSAQFTRGLSLWRSCGCCLEALLARMAWWPACCVVGIICRINRALEGIYAQAVRIAREEEEGETTGAAVTSASTFLQRREEQI